MGPGAVRAPRPHARGKLRRAPRPGGFIDPATFDLPYDSAYRPDLVLHWHSGFDLLAGREAFLPVDLLEMKTRKHDIGFTRRGARKHLATNGLGCGFTPEEAVLHGLCEYVERHAQRLAELLLVNPGGLGPIPYHFIDPGTCSAAVQDLAGRLCRHSDLVRVLEITSEVRIPTFVATITRDLRRADGYGTHPDPNVAVEMALLEAAQTIASATAGGREDLSIRARSLGRHERPRPVSPAMPGSGSTPTRTSARSTPGPGAGTSTCSRTWSGASNASGRRGWSTCWPSISPRRRSSPPGWSA